MMRCLYRLRRRVALIICPELATPAILRSPSVPDRPGYDGTTKPMERALRDRLAAERQLLERPGFFDVEDARQLARERKSGGVALGATSFLNQGDQADGQVVYAPQDQGCGPKSWEALQTVEQAAAFLEGASEEELREMGGRLLGDRPLSREEVFRQQLILRAQCSSERLTRRYFAAMGQVCPAASPHLAKCQQGTVS